MFDYNNRCTLFWYNLPNAMFKQTDDKAGTVMAGKDCKVGNQNVTMMYLGYADKYDGNLLLHV
jgi:hypothetical protein